VSQRLVARSPDLKRLQYEGYDLKVIGGTHLLVRQIPYVNAARQVQRGALVSVLTLHQDCTTKPGDHVTYLIGERPCDANGNPLTNIIVGDAPQHLAPGVDIHFTFSSKPTHGRGYADYHDKITTYAKMLLQEARVIDPTVTPRVYPVIESDESDPVFKYFDSASSRAGIDAINPKLAMQNVAIVGLGGTGSYILDFLAKTPVRNIHLFDDDRFLQHNAFRSPGAVAVEDMRADLRKVTHFQEVYSRLRHNVIAHPCRITRVNAAELRTMDFVFLCLDSGEEKDAVMAELESANVSFIDVGMGVHQANGALHGILRVTTSTPNRRDHVRDNGRVSFAPAAGDNEYARSIQVAELNALNAALAVVKWKKLCGFYSDLYSEHHSTYVIETGKLARYDQ
jgi:hypothetical protein